MTLVSALFVVGAAFLTATLSGVFGMAGGLVLMGCLALMLPVSAAFVTHGLQYDDFLSRRFMRIKHVRELQAEGGLDERLRRTTLEPSGV